MQQKELFRIPLKNAGTSFWDQKSNTFILIRDNNEVICRGPEMRRQVNSIVEEMNISEEVAVEMLYQFLSRCTACVNTVKLTADSKGYMYLEQVGFTGTMRIKRDGKIYTIFDKKSDLMRRYQFNFEKNEKAIIVYEITVELEHEKIVYTKNKIVVDSERTNPELVEFTVKGRKNEEKEIKLFLSVIRFFSFWDPKIKDKKQVAEVLKERIYEIIK